MIWYSQEMERLLPASACPGAGKLLAMGPAVLGHRSKRRLLGCLLTQVLFHLGWESSFGVKTVAPGTNLY